MQKIFTLITSLALVSSGTGCVITSSQPNNIVSAKQQVKFDVHNLSTWGSAQIQTIINSYLASAKNWYNPTTSSTTWRQWYLYKGPQKPSDYNAIIKAFTSIDPTFEGAYVMYTYIPYPQDNTDFKILLNKGIHLYMQAVGDTLPVKGKINFVIQGNI